MNTKNKKIKKKHDIKKTVKTLKKSVKKVAKDFKKAQNNIERQLENFDPLKDFKMDVMDDLDIDFKLNFDTKI